MADPNTLFAIVDVSNPTALKASLPDAAPWVYMELKTGGQWLLVAPKGTTTQEVSEKLGFNAPGKDTALVLRVDTYFGRNFAPVWEWIRTKRGAPLDTTTSI